MAKRTAREITGKDLDYILNLTTDELQRLSFIMKMFGKFGDKPPRFYPYDIITVPVGKYGTVKKNKNKFTTTVGLWIFNRFFIEDLGLDTIFGYINTPVGKKKFDQMNSEFSYAILEDRATIKQLKEFLDRSQKFQPYVSILAYNYTDVMLTITDKLNVRKKQLLKTYAKEIAARDGVTVSKIEKELLDYAAELLKDDPSIDMYNSGAIGDFFNNFKNMYVMKGAVQDPNDPERGYNIISSNLMDGISREDYAKFSASLAAGPFARSRKTASGGYMEKLFLNALQHIVLDEPGTDCGTKRYLEVILTNDYIREFMYSYIIEDGKLIELTSQNADKYRGKKVKIRFSGLCEGKKHICSKCAGNMFYRIGIRNAGVATPQYASRIKLRFMKSFHDSVVQYTDINVTEAFGFTD